MKFASFDISSMYSIIPTEELMTILNEVWNANDVDGKTTQEILRITQTLINQNYFQFQDTIYIHNEGLAMGGIYVIHTIRSIFTAHGEYYNP